MNDLNFHGGLPACMECFGRWLTIQRFGMAGLESSEEEDSEADDIVVEEAPRPDEEGDAN